MKLPSTEMGKSLRVVGLIRATKGSVLDLLNLKGQSDNQIQTLSRQLNIKLQIIIIIIKSIIIIEIFE